jgi:small subunit ribosomal protein S20
MPITTSAKKALRQNRTNRVRNTAKKEAYKKAVKTYRKLVSSKRTDEAATELAKAYQALDKAAKTNVITKNKASRLKSRMAKQLGK